MSQLPSRWCFVLSVSLFAAACAPGVSGRVVSDVRISGGWISVDRCLLQQVVGQGVRVRNCQTENYYLGKSAVPLRSYSENTAEQQSLHH